MRRDFVSAERLRSVVTYNPKSGLFRWLHRPFDEFPDIRSARIWNARYKGKPAFEADRNGYLAGKVDGVQYATHRLAWLYVNGCFPEDEIDHINGDRKDNRIANLRAVSRLENARNLKRYKSNSSGVQGVSRWPGKDLWRANIYYKGKHVHLGSFPTIEAAAAARREAESFYGFHLNHGRAF